MAKSPRISAFSEWHPPLKTRSRLGSHWIRWFWFLQSSSETPGGCKCITEIPVSGSSLRILSIAANPRLIAREIARSSHSRHIIPRNFLSISGETFRKLSSVRNVRHLYEREIPLFLLLPDDNRLQLLQWLKLTSLSKGNRLCTIILFNFHVASSPSRQEQEQQRQR